VAYDESGGMFAARLWWLARWLGHAQAAVLDGGLPAWREAGFPTSRDAPEPHTIGALLLHDPLGAQIGVDALFAELGSGRHRIVDARSPERYRGEQEPLDPVAGRIPGALNRPYQHNLQEDGRFKPAQVLR